MEEKKRRASLLEKNIIGDRVSAHLDARPALEDLRRRGIATHTTGAFRAFDANNRHSASECPWMHRRKSALERRIVGDRLNAHLDQQLEKEDSVPKKRRVSARLESTAGALAWAMRADGVRHSLSRRPSLDDLARRGILDASDARLGKTGNTFTNDADGDVPIASSLISKRHRLSINMTRDQLSYLLTGRPDFDDLENVLGAFKFLCKPSRRGQHGVSADPSDAQEARAQPSEVEPGPEAPQTS